VPASWEYSAVPQLGNPGRGSLSLLVRGNPLYIGVADGATPFAAATSEYLQREGVKNASTTIHRGVNLRTVLLPQLPATHSRYPYHHKRQNNDIMSVILCTGKSLLATIPQPSPMAPPFPTINSLPPRFTAIFGQDVL
jgi:hypothetical protein